jgi:hypothetical protein
MDRMGNGEHLGQCPTCGGFRWWDNRSRKAAGETSAATPDYVCVDCRHGRWDDGRHEPGRAAGRRRPPVAVTVVAATAGASGAEASAGWCAALKVDGTPCRNRPAAGSPFCGPHTDTGARSSPPVNGCRGTTKAGTPCRAGAQRGQEYCPQHQPDR